VFKTADGHLNIAASGQHMFRRLCEALGTEPLLDDPRFRTAPDRSKNRKALAVELEKGFAKRTTQEWVEVLNAKGVPSGPILDVKQVYEDEQIRHLKMAVPVKHPALGELLVQAPPVTLSRTPGAVRTPAPDTGEHNDQILTELGYSPSDIDTLRNDKVI
jgi:formyl-CoA transferase